MMQAPIKMVAQRAERMVATLPTSGNIAALARSRCKWLIRCT
jgi:hypothetical protein